MSIAIEGLAKGPDTHEHVRVSRYERRNGEASVRSAVGDDVDLR